MRKNVTIWLIETRQITLFRMVTVRRIAFRQDKPDKQDKIKIMWQGQL